MFLAFSLDSHHTCLLDFFLLLLLFFDEGNTVDYPYERIRRPSRLEAPDHQLDAVWYYPSHSCFHYVQLPCYIISSAGSSVAAHTLLWTSCHGYCPHRGLGQFPACSSKLLLVTTTIRTPNCNSFFPLAVDHKKN